MIDCSHGNCHKDHRRQAEVAASICDQVSAGSWQVFGAMLESHLVEGRQDYIPGKSAVYGQSITDACISLAQTEPLLENLAKAQQKREKRKAVRLLVRDLCIAVTAVVAAACESTTVPNMTYPVTKKGDVVDDYFGTKVPDPYRWMEDLDSKETAEWVAAQNQVTFDYLGKLPMRDRFKQRITELWDYPKVGMPVREGGRYFYQKNSGLQRQPPLYVAKQPRRPSRRS